VFWMWEDLPIAQSESMMVLLLSNPPLKMKNDFEHSPIDHISLSFCN
jgi:hypothetical protein